jgi:hypothetical protein
MSNQRPNNRAAKSIPPPPDTEEGYDAIIDYFSKYSTEELEKAGHLEEPSPREVEDLTASATYGLLCEKGLHLKLTRKNYEQLSRLAARQEVAPEELVKKWIQERLRAEARSQTRGRATDG